MVMLLNRQTMSGVCEFRVAGCEVRASRFWIHVRRFFCGLDFGLG